MTGDDVLAGRVVAEALSWVGTPYRHQGSRRGVGCDCLGLLLGVWQAMYGQVPEQPGAYAQDWDAGEDRDRYRRSIARHCLEKPSAAMRPGDLLLFCWHPHLPARHVGILVAEGRFVHAYQPHGVTVSALVSQWRRRIAGVFEFPPPRSQS